MQKLVFWIVVLAICLAVLSGLLGPEGAETLERIRSLVLGADAVDPNAVDPNSVALPAPVVPPEPVGFFARLFGDPRQIIVAVVAAIVMGAVGFALTMGGGTLARAGQQEKIALWGALLLSVVSAITTSSGLLQVLSPNPQTGAILMVAMALLLGVGIQLSMLMYALRIGDSAQRLQGFQAESSSQDAFDEADPYGTRRRDIKIALAFGAFAIGVFMLLGDTLMDIVRHLVDSIYSGRFASSENTPKILGGILIAVAAAMVLRLGLIRRPGTILGLLGSLGIYLALLTFSAGFGYVSYFISSQSPQVQAIDRDNVIETQTSALVRQIRVAADEDVREALLEARTGDDYKDLAFRIDTLADLFVTNASVVQKQILAREAAISRLETERSAARQGAALAQSNLTNANSALTRATNALTAAETAKMQKLTRLQGLANQADQEAIDAENGQDETGIKKCGPICNDAKSRAASWRAQIAQLDTDIAKARLNVQNANSAIQAAQDAVDKASTLSNGEDIDTPIPPRVVDRTSFLLPMGEYNTAPTKENLYKISSTCAAARDMLSAGGVSATQLPDCNISAVEAWLVRHEEGQAAKGLMVVPCKRTQGELAEEAAASATNLDASITAIPPHLQGRLKWVARCLTAANTGSPRMTELARKVNQLESEYTTPEYDTRRALRSLGDNNLYAIFAALMAIIVDTAILFAGLAANAYRARELGEDHTVVPTDKIADRIRKAFETINPTAPYMAAQQVQMLCHPRSHDDMDGTPFTHHLNGDNHAGKVQANVKLVMDSAGTAFARFVKSDNGSGWLVHRNLIGLITEHAISGQSTTAGTIWQNTPVVSVGGVAGSSLPRNSGSSPAVSGQTARPRRSSSGVPDAGTAPDSYGGRGSPDTPAQPKRQGPHQVPPPKDAGPKPEK